MAKTFPLSEFARLKQFMGIAFSSEHTGERLNALDMANKLLKKYDTNWTELIDRRVEVVHHSSSTVQTHRTYDYGPSDSDEEMETPRSDDWRPGIRVAFDEIRGTIKSDSFRATVEDIEKTFDQTNYLTPGQRSVIWKAQSEYRRGMGR